MMHSASVVLPEPEPPSTAAWRLSTSLLSVMLLLDRKRPAGQDAAGAVARLVEQQRQRDVLLRVGRRRRRVAPAGPVGGMRPPHRQGRRPARRGFRTRLLGFGRLCCRRRGGFPWAQAATEQVEAQQLHERQNLRQQLGALEPVGEARDRGGAARGTRAPSSCAPSRGSAPAASARPSRGTCGRPARSGSSCWAESRWRAA